MEAISLWKILEGEVFCPKIYGTSCCLCEYELRVTFRESGINYPDSLDMENGKYLRLSLSSSSLHLENSRDKNQLNLLKLILSGRELTSMENNSSSSRSESSANKLAYMQCYRIMVKFIPGDVIIECYPLAHAISVQEQIFRCNFCFRKSASLRKCSACKSIRYCSTDCQSKDWKSMHKYECKIPIIESSQPVEPHLSNLYYRTKVLLGEQIEKFRTPIRTFDGEIKMADVMVKEAEKTEKNQPKGEENQSYRDSSSSKPSPLEDFSLAEKILDMFHVTMLLRRSDIRDNNLNFIGSGVYIPSAYYDFSCKSNCCLTFDGIKMQLRATKNFDTDDQPPLIAYVYPELMDPPREIFEESELHAACRCDQCSPDSRNRKSLMDLKKQFNVALSIGDADEALIKGLELLELERNIFPSPNPYRTILLKELVELSNKLKDDRTTILVKDLQDNFLITHGIKHSLSEEVESICNHYLK
ncbi:N-lysine methyltransferase SMYD2-like [Brevipalpus obovatus]|uniref:N-lysine methyltransferase SMYD2-like n=1 Tax=Brevipalpus obovatus TaxID=246614 RepID=UPI003D9DC6CC